MDDREYEQLLDKAYTELPEVLYTQGRFEIPKVSGRLIKSRTVINNFREIAKHFARPEEHLLKYFLREAGVRGEIDVKGALILHTRTQPAFLNKIVEKYFANYIECSYCRSPDTVLTDNDMLIKCNACGHQEKITKL